MLRSLRSKEAGPRPHRHLWVSCEQTSEDPRDLAPGSPRSLGTATLPTQEENHSVQLRQRQRQPARSSHLPSPPPPRRNRQAWPDAGQNTRSRRLCRCVTGWRWANDSPGECRFLGPGRWGPELPAFQSSKSFPWAGRCAPRGGPRAGGGAERVTLPRRLVGPGEERREAGSLPRAF